MGSAHCRTHVRGQLRVLGQVCSGGCHAAGHRRRVTRAASCSDGCDSSLRTRDSPWLLVDMPSHAPTAPGLFAECTQRPGAVPLPGSTRVGLDGFGEGAAGTGRIAKTAASKQAQKHGQPGSER